MCTGYFGRFPCAFGFLVLLQLAYSRPLEGTDKLSDVRNLPEEDRVVQRSTTYHGVYNAALSTSKHGNYSANSGQPGCCTPELHLGFDNTTADQQELHGRRAQFPTVTSVEAPCGEYADLNAEHVQFKSAKLPTKTNAITIAVWIKLHSTSGIQPILIVPGEVGELRLELADGHLSWLYTATRPSLASFAVLSAVPVMPSNLWTHLVVQYDGHTQRSAVFLNGEKLLQSRSITSGGSLEIAWGEFTAIGKYSINEVLELRLNGFMDEFYIYYCAVPELVIQRLAQTCRVEGKCAPVGPGVDAPCDANGQEWRCDGENDCGDWSDEMGCDGFCGPGEQISTFQGKCVSCFCMGRSLNCSHANMYRNRLKLEVNNFLGGPIMHLVDVHGDKVSGIKYTADQASNGLVAHDVSENIQYYWVLPREFLGNQLASYDGKLRYTVEYIPKNPIRHPRDVREIIFSRNFEADYMIDRNGDEDVNDNDGSGLPMVNISTNEGVFIDSQNETSTTISKTGTDSLETTTSTAYSTERPTLETATTIQDKTVSVTGASNDGQDETTSFVSSDMSLLVSDDSEDRNINDAPSTDRPTRESSTTVPGTSTKGQDETAVPPSSVYTTLTPTFSTVTDATTDSQYETTTAVSLSNSAERSTTEAPTTTLATTITVTEGEDESTTSVPSIAYSSEKPAMESSITIQDVSSTVTGASTEGHDETTTSLFSSVYNTDIPTTEILTTIPDASSTLPEVRTYDQDEATTSVPSAAPSTEIPTTGASTTTPDMSSSVTDASTTSHDETTTDVPSTAYSTHRPTAEASTTILETSSLVSDASTESEDETTAFVPSSAYGTERLTTEASTTTQDTTYPVTDTSSEGQDETTTVVPSSAYSTERPTTEKFTIPEAPTGGQGETTTALPSLTYSTDRPTMEIVTTIPDVSSTFTEAATEGQDETITFESSSGYSTQRPTTEASTTIPHTSSTITDAPTAGHDETTTVSIPVTSSIQTDSVSEDPDETTTVVPSSAYRTDTLTTETIPVTHFSKTDTLAVDEEEATTVLPSSAYNTQRTTTEASTTILETSSTVTDATTDIPDETSTFVPSPTFSTDRPTRKTDDRPSSVTDALKEGQDETTTSAYSTYRPTIEAAATTPDTSSTVTVTKGQYETTTYALSTGASTTTPDMSSSVTDASTASQDETTTDVPSTAYSTNRPTAEASTTILETSSLVSDASTEREDETTTFVPSSAHGSERLTTEASTTTQYTTYPVTDTLSEGQDETATVVPSSVYSTDRPTTETSTTIPVTSITETEGDDESTTSVPSLEYSSERPTKELSTTIQDMSSTVTDALTKGQDQTTTSAYSTDRPTMEAAATTPDTSSTVTVTEGQDETTTYAPSTVYNTENHTTEHSTTIPETSTMVTHSLTDYQDETSTVMPSSVYSTDEPSTLTVTTISDTFSTVRDVSTVNTDETTSFTPVASQSTETPTTEASTTKVDISYKETDAWTDSQDITTAYSTERSTMESSTTLPVTSSAITDVFTDVQDATTTSVPSSAHSTKPLNPDTTTTRPETSSIVTDASIDSQDETTTYVPSSAYSTENVLSETVTTISDTYSTVTDASTKSSDETTTVVFSSAHSTESPTSDKPTTITETSSTVPDASTDGQVGPTTLTTILDMSSTVADELTDGQEETTTSVSSTAYSIEKPTTETVTTIPGSSSTVTVASTEAQDETTTFVPSWSVSTEDRGTETVTTIPDASPTVTDVSTEAQVETTAAGLSSAHSTDKPTTEASTTIPVTSSTVTDASTSDQGVTTTAVPSAAPTSVAATSTSDPEIRCQFGDGFYPTNTTFVTESCTSRCSCLEDGNLRCFPLCVDDFPYCDDDEEEVESYVPVENSSCHCVERVCVREDVTTPTSAFAKITEAASTPSVQITEAVRLVGKDTTLVFHHEVGPSSGNSQTTMEVSLTEAKWRSPDGARTSRDTFMKVLSDVQAIYVRASYSGDGSSIRALSIKDLSLDVASQHDAGFGKALLVEQCDCPAGYSGLSCEYCSPGFTRSGDGLDCMKCSCNNHSDTCDQGNGTCLDCRDNTEGIYCDRCQSGYFGNALKGTPTDCQPCPCPLTMSPNKFSPTCFLGDDGLPTCDACPEGYAGRNCEQCAIKYKGNPTIRNSKCELTVPKHCDFRGGLDTKPDARTQKCFCKSNVHGITCDACKPGFFNLKSDNPQGCTPCFCNGVTNSCRSATVNETQVNITDQSRGTSVEQCACPPEYEGLSCGSCKPGYYKSRVGPYLGKCIKCNCHGHSDDACDPETGQCKTCQHNTGGFRCEKCLTGFYGNATIGKQTDCKECPCPMTSPPNRFSPTCFMAEDGHPTCDACPPGYGGRRCDKCIKPYVGNPTEPGRKCKREVDCRCDVRGSVNSTCDPETRQCFCKKHVEGQTCDRCKRSFFNLQSDEPEGCVSCFCFGVSRDCKCADYYKDLIRIRIALLQGPDYLRLSDLSRDSIISSGIQVQSHPGHYVYDTFDKLPVVTYYWFLGEEFRGDMMTSYDGILRYTVSHEMTPGGELTSETDIQLTGRGIVLIYRHGRRLEGGKKGAFGLKLSENWLRFPDGGRVTRDNVMTMLSAVESILIRATYSTTTTRASLYDVNVQTAVPQATRYGKAKNIEECACPPEYTGTSCQRCAHGYTRSYSGPDFSPCVPCSCNQHSKECDPEKGQCTRCDHFTTGFQCEKCAVGFYGDATKETPKDCQPCPCPLTITSNQFSRICKLDTDGNPTCTACQTGYTGRNCERCAKGYSGNPSKPGEKCVKLPAGYLPMVRVRPVKRIKNEGKNAFFYCFASGQQKPRFAWSRTNGEPMSRRVSVNGKRLRIRGVKKEDEGTYVCTARNVYGSETASGQLVVRDRLEDPIVVSVSPKVLHVPLNHSAQFTCSVKSVTEYRLKWTRGMYGALPKGAVSENGVLKIQHTQSIHGGTYTCTGKNSFTDDMASVQLRVGVTKPQVFISPARLSVREGDSAQFRCSASGFSASVLQWHGGPGGRLPSEAESSNGNGLLTFVEVKKIHEGEYFCTAKNLGGISSTVMFLNVSAAGSVPVISISPSSLTVSEGEEALFECRANGDPIPTIRWSRENGQFPQSSSLVNGVLRIFPTKPEDEGAYICTAANAFGAKASPVTLNVNKDASVAPTAVVTPAKQTVNEGASAILSCKVTGFPHPTIQWTKIGGTLTENHVIEESLLRIQRVEKEDEGMYVCVAQNKKGVDQATGIVDVRIKVMPKIEIKPARNLTVTGGETVVFRCIVKAGNPPPAVVWEREENEPLNSSNDGVLVISAASGDSQGKYICKATNVLGSTEAVALLIVQGQPKIIVSPYSLVSVTAGSSVTLECAAAGDPPPVIQWITQEHSRSNLQLIESGRGVLKLFIEEARPEDQGNYTCQAQNLVGKTQESVQIIVKVLPKIEIKPARNLTVTGGEIVVFRCEVKAGNPPPVVVWEREENEPLNSSNDGVLVISAVSGDSQGKYICKATNVLGSTEAVALLIVQGEPKLIVSPSSLVSVTAGSSVTLECAATGIPTPVVQWITQEHSRSNHQLTESGRGVLKLVIEDARPEDQGNYTCQAQNLVGKTQESVQLIVKVMPKIDIMPARKLTVTGGETVVFRCVVKAGNPPPAVVWEREENEPLNSSNDGVLVISAASGDSQGKYICKATNVLGSTEAVALLIVQGEPKLIVSPSSLVSVTAGSSVTLECAAAGNPPPVIQWITQEHSRSNHQLIESGRGLLKLFIEDTRPEDQGNYTCQAQNLVGKTQESVQLIVTVAHEPPEIHVKPISQTVIQREEVEFRCNASGIPTPSIIWERLGSNLPDGAFDRNGVLIITSVGSEDAGTYTCKAANSEGEDRFNVQLEVIVPPRVDVTPSKISVNQGNSFSLFCIVTPLLPVTWSKVNGSIPDGSDNEKGTLRVNKAIVEHAGEYRCHASNAAGSSEAFASVTVFAAPKVIAWPNSLIASPNSNVRFQCNATGIPDPVITWTKEGGDLPKRHSVVDGVLNLTRLVSVDDGRYICMATNAAGASVVAVKLTVEDLPSVSITGGTSVKTVSVGGNLTLECIGTGIAQPEIQWSRVDGSLPEGLIIEGGLLFIPKARHSYAGVYRCGVTNRVGSAQSEVAIFVQEVPKVIVTAQKLRVKIGEPAEFPCIASGSPSPELTWRKVNGSLPVSSTVQEGVLRIANVTQEDAGIYVCEASNVEGSANGSGVLEIKVTVPRFTQKPLSYLRLRTLTEEPLNFTVEIAFIPETADGLILYNDQLTNGSVGDFISFGMSDGFAEFRFNLGFEPAIIRSQQPLLLYEWHTVILSRDKKVGNLTVDGKPLVTGVSKGGSTGLNLNQDLYVGGVPDFAAISSLSGFKSGFIGCLSFLAIDGKVGNLVDAMNLVGLDDCEVCQTRPCKNGGTCTEVARDWGFVCSCRPGYLGRTCHSAGQQCSPGVCNEGRCENVGNDGFRCICPAGYSGERCEKGTSIDTPMFEGDSFMSFPGIEGAVRQLKFSIKFMALKSGNMLLLYNGQKTYPARADFISLAINGGRVEFKFNMGSGPGILRSARNVSLGFWHTVTVKRRLDESLLILDNDPPVKGSSPCCSVGLNLVLDLFIGGVKNFTTFDTSKVGVSSGLFGCVSRVSVDGREINLLKSNLDLRGIKQCTECLLPCEIKPCMNNATCIPVGKTGFVCSCAPGYSGQKCEFTLVGPGKNKTCLNGGVELTSYDRICACPLGYGGERCKSFVQLGDSASFSGDGFLEFPSSAMRGPRVVKPDYMSLEIKTEAQNGVILWQGKRRDHFSIGLRDGFLEFRFELGSGPAVLLSLLRVNDSLWHSVEVFRSFNEGSLKVDNEDHVNGTSAEGSKGLNIDEGSNIFLGGGDNIQELTHGKFDTGFAGCVRKVFFKNRNINLQDDANRGWNVLPCDGEVAET